MPRNIDSKPLPRQSRDSKTPLQRALENFQDIPDAAHRTGIGEDERLAHRLFGDFREAVRPDADIAEPRRQAQAGNQIGHQIGCGAVGCPIASDTTCWRSPPACRFQRSTGASMTQEV